MEGPYFLGQLSSALKVNLKVRLERRIFKVPIGNRQIGLTISSAIASEGQLTDFVFLLLQTNINQPAAIDTFPPKSTILKESNKNEEGNIFK